MRYFTHETFEAPDADGSCCHLRETGLGELCDADEARETERQLKEAAALLARVKTGDQQFASDIDRWFFRAPAQPEPTQAGSEAGAKYFDWDRTPTQAAAPAAEPHYAEQLGIDPAPGFQPAESAEAQLAAVRTIATDMVAQLQKVGYLPAKTRVMRYEGFIEALMRGFVDIAALLTAPSPGEWEETL